MIYFTSDLHLGHVRALEIMPHRPWATVDEMDAGLISNYNDVVGDNDTCIFLGDVIMGRKSENVPKYLNHLRGTKILICGNHDFLPSELKPEKLQAMEDLYLATGISEIAYGCVGLDRFTLDSNDFNIKLCHFPTADTEDDRTNEYEQRYTHLRPAIHPSQWLLHGHTHSRDSISGVNSTHIGVDAAVWDYKPVSLDTIRKVIENK